MVAALMLWRWSPSLPPSAKRCCTMSRMNEAILSLIRCVAAFPDEASSLSPPSFFLLD